MRRILKLSCLFLAAMESGLGATTFQEDGTLDTVILGTDLVMDDAPAGAAPLSPADPGQKEDEPAPAGTDTAPLSPIDLDEKGEKEKKEEERKTCCTIL